eukprot:4309216-Pleurochrysis_carterae.AAC.2
MDHRGPCRNECEELLMKMFAFGDLVKSKGQGRRGPWNLKGPIQNYHHCMLALLSHGLGMVSQETSAETGIGSAASAASAQLEPCRLLERGSGTQDAQSPERVQNASIHPGSQTTNWGVYEFGAWRIVGTNVICGVYMRYPIRILPDPRFAICKVFYSFCYCLCPCPL